MRLKIVLNTQGKPVNNYLITLTGNEGRKLYSGKAIGDDIIVNLEHCDDCHFGNKYYVNVDDELYLDFISSNGHTSTCVVFNQEDIDNNLKHIIVEESCKILHIKH